MAKITERPITVLMIHTALVVLAFFELSHLPIELSPESDFPRLSVITNYPGASSELVVQSITLPIEEAASTLDEVKDISSTSQQGQSIVDIQLQKNSNVDFVRLNLLEKLSVVAEHLPEGASFPLIAKYVPEDFRKLQGFMTYTIYGDLSLSQIQRFAEDYIKPQILAVKGVASVRILGGAKRELYVLIDRNKMRALGVKFPDVFSALQESQYVQSGGELVVGNVRQSVLVGSVIGHTNDLDGIMIRGSGERGYARLGDFARVVDSISAPTTLVRINGKPSVTIEIDKEPGINMLSVSSDVDAKVAGIVRSLSSEGSFGANLHIEKISDRSVDVRREVNELSSKALYAGLLILIVVFFFFFQKRHLFGNLLVSVIMVISVVFSVGVGVIFLAISGIGLNVITLAALALSLGIAIDNNVVVSESIYREFEKRDQEREYGKWNTENRKAGDLEKESSSGVQSGLFGVDRIAQAENQVRLPLIAATLTTVGALLPVFFLPPELKEFFIPFAETTAVVVISSLIVAFTFLPVSIMLLIRGGAYVSANREPRTLTLLKKIYVPTSKWLIRHKVFSVVIAVWLVGFPIWLLPERIDYSPPQQQNTHSIFEKVSKKTVGFLVDAYNSTFGSDFYLNIRPYINYGLGGATQLFFKHVYKGEIWSFGSETYLVMSVYAPQGTPIENIDQFAKQIEKLPNMKWVKRMTTRVTPEYASVRIDFADSVAATAIPFIIKDRLTSLAAQSGGFTVSVSGFGPGFYSGGEISPNFTITVTGYNYESVREIAEKVRARLVRNPRVDNVQIDRLPWESENYEVRGEINREYLNSLGLNVEEFMTRFTPFVSSFLQRSSISISNQPVDLVVKFNDYSNQSTENLPNQEIDIGRGRVMRVGNAVSFTKSPVMPVIERDNQQYIRYITFDFKGPYKLGDVYTDEVVKSISTPPGYEVKRPNYWFTFEAKETIPLVLLSALAILIVFMITASLYESYWKPFIVMLSVPMSLIGLFATFFFADANFGRGGYASVLFLIGLSVNNGILLVDKISSALREKESGVRRRETGLAYDMNSAVETPPHIDRVGLIAEAASERLRPILMTALVTIAGFVPFVINADIYSFWYSFALGIIGGITVSSLMILLFTPVFYDLISPF